MTLPITFARDTVTVIRPGTATDGYGDTTDDWSAATETHVPGCVLSPLAGPEQAAGTRSSVVSRWQLRAPAETDITARDRIRYRGEVYAVTGSAEHWPSPSHRLAHVAVVLERTEG